MNHSHHIAVRMFEKPSKSFHGEGPRRVKGMGILQIYQNNETRLLVTALPM